MTPEEYQRLKEAEKEHLRKLKELKSAVRQLERQKKVTRAITDITDTPRTLLDQNAELVEQLAMEAARSEAKLDIALETAAEREAAPSSSPQPPIGEAEAEEEMRRLRAQQLLRQLREETAPTSVPAPPAASPPAKSGSDEGRRDLPEKTIGRMKP